MFVWLQPEADGGVDEPVVQIAAGGMMAVADGVELSVGIDVEPGKVVGERHAGVVAQAESAVECLVARRAYAYIVVVPFIPFFERYILVPEGGIFHQLLHVGGITIGLELVDKGQHRHEHDVDKQSADRIQRSVPVLSQNSNSEWQPYDHNVCTNVQL